MDWIKLAWQAIDCARDARLIGDHADAVWFQNLAAHYRWRATCWIVVR
jgi:hypothetical protein